MATEKKSLFGLDPSKYPARMGKPWKDEEIMQLLQSIQKKKSIEEIAVEHGRTVGGINSRRRELAADYHFNADRTIEEIQKFTGLTKEEVEEAIKRRSRPKLVKSKEVVNTLVESSKESATNINDVMELLKDIQAKINVVLEKIK